ncbi:ABC transporter substrate-binding protein [Romeria aff. gracilis LEGE 07310]|uniref:ABC transporter substrate-binding protein n=1 Tax=Vasconcelosia minhoensis LEGE 07310 TaxID=915328 RepID=A0A8J7DM37_9CYAN|nr:ABC transporter substrate-binding protein [Romeria gracilis]MBE9075875.1 ABC transporter substrate-binding protein [Romeria aff. gracilis LEGE 07310]
MRKSFSKPLGLGAIALSALLFVTACQSPPDSATAEDAQSEATTEVAADAEPQSLTPVKFTLSWLLQGVDAPMTLAMERGYFAEEGIDLQFERGYGSADTASKIAAGQYDMGFGDMYSMIEFNQQNPDQKLVAVAVPYNKAPFVLVALEESGIDSIEDMAGKKLGAPAGDAPRRLWPVLAEEVGVEADSVEWVTMEPKLRETFLLQGEVDAISGFIYSMMPSLVKGGKSEDDLNIFYYTDNGLNFYGNVVLVKESFLEENPELVEGFITAYIKGLQDTLKDPEAGLDSVMAVGDDLMERDAEKLRLQIALNNLIVSAEVEANGIGAVDSERLKESIAQTVEGFDLETTPAVEEVFDGSYLPPLEERQLPPESERQSLE